MTRTGSTCKLRCPGPSVNEPIAGLMPRSLPMQLDYRGARCNEGRGAIPAVHAGENHTIQIALVGCGGRGTGAAANALATKSGPVKLVAMADVFEHRLKSSYETLTSIGGDAGNGSPDRAVAGYDPAQVDVPPDRRFPRVRRLQEGHGLPQAWRCRSPDHPLRVPLGPFRPRHRQGHQRLHGEADDRRWTKHAEDAGAG